MLSRKKSSNILRRCSTFCAKFGIYSIIGIKKIVSILQLLIVVYNNPSITVAIDELDSGIFESLLGELLNIISEKGKGQLIFTSHNLRPLSDQQSIIERNKQKTDNLYHLRGTGQIWKIPYRVYYMSCNLDHVLHNKRNSTDDEKETDAFVFAKKYKNDVNGFVSFICDSEFSVKGDYKESWMHIEDGMNSIERYTNLGICIMEETIRI